MFKLTLRMFILKKVREAKGKMFRSTVLKIYVDVQDNLHKLKIVWDALISICNILFGQEQENIVCKLIKNGNFKAIIW